MNLLAIEVADDGMVKVEGQSVHLPAGMRLLQGQFKLGIRPEYTRLAPTGQPGVVAATVVKVQNIGTYQLLTARVGSSLVRARLGLWHELPQAGATTGLVLLGPHSCFYRDEELVV
jgi:glycerol transport system ATP-binding protein